MTIDLPHPLSPEKWNNISMHLKLNSVHINTKITIFSLINLSVAL